MRTLKSFIPITVFSYIDVIIRIKDAFCQSFFRKIGEKTKKGVLRVKKILRLKRIWLLLLLPVCFLLLVFAKRYPDFAQWIAQGPYLVYAKILSTLTRWMPFSLMEILILLLCVFVPVFLVVSVVQLIRKKRGFWKFFLNLFCVISIVFAMFTFGCGTNYYRYTFAERSGLTLQKSTDEELAALCRALALKINEVRPQLSEDESGVMSTEQLEYSEIASRAAEEISALGADYPEFESDLGAPKPVLLSRMMSYTNTSGIFSAFTMEANVNTDMPDYLLPATMCHELSHLHGYMREDEANFIAYLACRQSESPEFRYSGLMLAFLYSNNALFASDRELGSECYALLCEGARRDFAANSAYWKQFEGKVAEVSQKINDAYLKANDQSDGTKSYGRMVDLLLALYRRDGAV